MELVKENLDAFLDEVDLVVDGLDYFVLDLRRKLFQRARERSIPVLTVGPIAFGASFYFFYLIRESALKSIAPFRDLKLQTRDT